MIASTACACSHAYIFAGDAPPRIAADQVVIERVGEPGESFTIERVLVQDERGAARLPSTDDLRAWQAGEPTPELDVIRVDVSTSGVVWRDWVMPGFGIGAGLVFVVLGSLGGIEPSNADGDFGGFTLPLAMLLATVVGLEGALIGAGIGALAEGGTTDMRLPGGAPVGTDAWPLELGR
ncbi:MAG: hypothetical protein IT385_30405 [Deltaproteobacteria bacterium]|nr:hypothetical protein [Deltaproteobacteria bacterium]